MRKVSTASLRFLGRYLLILLLLLWAVGQLVWCGYLLADPPTAYLPDTPLGRLECASWLLASALATLAVANLLATAISVPWHLVSLIAVTGWLALPLRSAWGAWSAIGTFTFEPFTDPLALPIPVVSGWFAVTLLALGAGLVGRGR
ncbi:hypothetical protein [Thermomicrobium roseum]|uniref:Uncharacterized protein n=1 Tax=Thermomicrobium roseum (strain ATCC 27502 / DSM 5159 / P-2) TaxID=309801 RepID=B9L3B8_THERP|nr:hypothetical protein [Thermomicrobium roseum]ACM06917.1 hypothetical protein trd_A0282 [Thermomicrobium roseum DSM 5159]